MTEPIDKTNRTPLDDQLDAALAKYAAVEPRAGLEQRILANLKAQERPVTNPIWWRWAAVPAVALVITMLVFWRAEKHRPEQVVQHPANPSQKSQPQIANRDTSGSQEQSPVRVAVRRPRKRASSRVTLAVGEASAKPKLDQFPSPQPLSQEELVLARYAAEFPAEATLVAKAQDEYQREVQQEMRSMDSGIRPSGLDKQER
jgi:hypothetical protein